MATLAIERDERGGVILTVDVPGAFAFSARLADAEVAHEALGAVLGGESAVEVQLDVESTSVPAQVVQLVPKSDDA